MGKSKVRSFIVASFLPSDRPFGVVARSRLELQRRLCGALQCAEVVSCELVSALWEGKPVLVLDVGVLLVPGRFPGVSYQLMGSSRGAVN